MSGEEMHLVPKLHLETRCISRNPPTEGQFRDSDHIYNQLISLRSYHSGK